MNPVPVDVSGWRQAHRHLAPLALSFRPAEGAEAAVIDGSGDWPRRALALVTAHRAVLVIDPRPVPGAAVAGLRAAAAVADVSVLFSQPWADALPVAAGPVVRDAVLVDLAAETTGSVAAAAWRAAALCHRLWGDVARATVMTDARRRVGQGVIVVSGVVTAYRERIVRIGRAERVRLRVLTASGRVELDLPDGADARPATITFGDASGSTVAPTVYRSVVRHSLHRFHATLTSGRADHSDLERFARFATAVDS